MGELPWGGSVLETAQELVGVRPDAVERARRGLGGAGAAGDGVLVGLGVVGTASANPGAIETLVAPSGHVHGVGPRAFSSQGLGNRLISWRLSRWRGKISRKYGMALLSLDRAFCALR